MILRDRTAAGCLSTILALLKTKRLSRHPSTVTRDGNVWQSSMGFCLHSENSRNFKQLIGLHMFAFDGNDTSARSTTAATTKWIRRIYLLSLIHTGMVDVKVDIGREDKNPDVPWISIYLSRVWVAGITEKGSSLNSPLWWSNAFEVDLFFSLPRSETHNGSWSVKKNNIHPSSWIHSFVPFFCYCLSVSQLVTKA